MHFLEKFQEGFLENGKLVSRWGWLGWLERRVFGVEGRKNRGIVWCGVGWVKGK